MSIQAVGEVLETDIGEVAAKMLLISLANAHNKSTGLCCPSIDRLAKESSMGRSTVKRWLRWLEQHRYIRVVPIHDDNRRQQANQYELTLGEGSSLDPLTEPACEPGEGPTVGPLGGSACEPPLKKPEEYRKKERECARVDFEEVWTIFPRRKLTNRAEAEEAFGALSDDETHQCLAGAQRFAQWHLEAAKDRGEEPEAALEFRPGLGKWIRTKAYVEALSVTLKADKEATVDWLDRVQRYRRGEFNWPHIWGPKPEEPGCRALMAVLIGDPMAPFIEEAWGRKLFWGQRSTTVPAWIYDDALALKERAQAA